MKYLKNILGALLLAFVLASGAHAQTALSGLDGAKVDIHGQRGKVVVLALGASWLPLSVKQAEYTNMLARKYAGRDVVVYFVATDSAAASSRNFASNDDLQKFRTSSKLNVPLLRDPDGVLTLKRFSIDQIPSFVILDKNGAIVGEAFGGIDPKFDITVPISKRIDSLL